MQSQKLNALMPWIRRMTARAQDKEMARAQDKEMRQI